MANGREREPRGNWGGSPDRGFAAHARGLRPRFFSPRANLANSTPPQFPRGSLSLPFAINKARALGRESCQLRRLNQYLLGHLDYQSDKQTKTLEGI